MNTELALIIGYVFQAATAIGVIGALLYSARQNRLTSRAIRAQSFVDLLSLEVRSGFQRGILAITTLRRYDDFAEFEMGETEETKQAIYGAVVFLNFMAVLGEEGYLHIQDAWDVYFWSYRKCHEKLLPWWLAGQRDGQPHVFPSFERACSATSLVSAEQIEAFDARIGVKHLKKYRATSGVARNKLRQALSHQIPPIHRERAPV